jgi:hypothetical protein
LSHQELRSRFLRRHRLRPLGRGRGGRRLGRQRFVRAGVDVMNQFGP